jgi:Na+-transporting methylmalonyl-CoA/oxaloacetate decarboxylase gamma subunit
MNITVDIIYVVVAMIIIFVIYHLLVVRPMIKSGEKSTSIKTKSANVSKPKSDDQNEVNEEVSAVIGLALHLYKQQLSDFEKARLTIARVSRTYSPWSSKIYGLRQNPRR